MGVREGLGTACTSARIWHLQQSSSISWSMLAHSHSSIPELEDRNSRCEVYTHLWSQSCPRHAQPELGCKC